MATKKVQSFDVYCTLRSKGDGSAGVHFHADKEAAQIACDLEDAGGEPFGDNYPLKITLKFNAAGTLLNPTISKEDLRAALAEARGEDAPAAAPTAKPRHKR